MAGLLGSEIMDEAALLLNDNARVTFTYAIQAPWLKRALNTLSDELIVNSIKLTKKITSPVLTVASGVAILALPADAIIPIKLEERLSGSSFPFTDMGQMLELPAGLTAKESLDYWAYEGTLLNSVPVVNFIGATTAREVRITYERFIPYSGATNATDFSTDLSWNCKIVLSTKVAELINKFVLLNEKRAGVLNGEYIDAKYRLIKIWVKQAQGSPIRKPGYRRF